VLLFLITTNFGANRNGMAKNPTMFTKPRKGLIYNRGIPLGKTILIEVGSSTTKSTYMSNLAYKSLDMEVLSMSQ